MKFTNQIIYFYSTYCTRSIIVVDVTAKSQNPCVYQPFEEKKKTLENDNHA